MYVMQAEEAARPEGGPALNEQLERDTSGQLRERLAGELRQAAGSIDSALGTGATQDEARVLRPLREAIQLAERVLIETWHSFHG